MKNENKLQWDYDLQNPWYRDSREPVDAQLLQATLAIYTAHYANPYPLENGIDTMIWAARMARDLLTTIRMDEADRNGTLLPNITPEMPDDLDPNFAPM